jgi:hypothetical protein
LEVKSAREHRTAFQHCLFGVDEKVVGPGHRVAQRVVAFQAAPRADQQPEPVIKAITHFTGGHRRHPGGSQFDGQWNPVQALTNLGDCGSFIAVDHREARCNALSAFDEQTHRRRVDSRCGVQRAHRPNLLVGDSESLAAGDPTRRSNASWRERDQAARSALIRAIGAAIALAAYPTSHRAGRDRRSTASTAARLGAQSANLEQTAHYSQAIAHFVDRRSRTWTTPRRARSGPAACPRDHSWRCRAPP